MSLSNCFIHIFHHCSFQKLTRRLWSDVFPCLFISTTWFRMYQRAHASSQLHPGPPTHTSKYIQLQTVFCHIWFLQGSNSGETPPLWENCSVISPYSPNKFSKVNSYTSPQTEGNSILSAPAPLSLPKGPGHYAVHIKHTLFSAASAITGICMLICVDGLECKNDTRVSVHGQIMTPGECLEENMPNTH